MTDRLSMTARLLAPLSMLLLLLAACEQDNGAPCQADSDCSSGYCCTGENDRGECADRDEEATCDPSSNVSSTTDNGTGGASDTPDTPDSDAGDETADTDSDAG